MTLQNARLFAKQLGGDLVAIETVEELKFIQSLAQSFVRIGQWCYHISMEDLIFAAGG